MARKTPKQRNRARTAAGFRNAVRGLEDGLFAWLNGRKSRSGPGSVDRRWPPRALIADRPKLQESLRPPPLLPAPGSTPPTTLPASSGWRRRSPGYGRNFRQRSRTRRTWRGPFDRRGTRAPAIGLSMRQRLAARRIPSCGLSGVGAEKGGAVAVWGLGGLVDNLCALAQRRLLEGTRLPDGPFSAWARDRPTRACRPRSTAMGSRLASKPGGFDEVIAEPLAASPGSSPAWGGVATAAIAFGLGGVEALFVTPAAFLGSNGRSRTCRFRPPSGELIAGPVEEADHLGQHRARATGLPTPFSRRGGMVPCAIRFWFRPPSVRGPRHPGHRRRAARLSQPGLSYR